MRTSNPHANSSLSSKHLQSDVCIVGNGVIGKTAALGFAQAGQSVVLLCPPGDAPPSAAGWDVRVYALNHVARALLSSLKVWDALDAARIEAVDAMMINGDGDRTAGKLAFDAYGAHVDALAWIVEDGNLNQALDAALKFASNVRIIKGTAVGLDNGGMTATVRLDDGTTLGASLLVGADGGQSWVRGQCDIGIDYRSYGQRAVVANFECENPHHGMAHQWFTAAEGVVALLPLPGRRVSLVWSAPDLLADTLLQETLVQLAQRLTALAGASPLGQLKPLQPEQVKALPLSLVRPAATIAPRVVLVGDAAHVVHPLAGQGMNLGFADVAALLATIARRASHRDCGDSRVLAQYARSRKEEILLMQMTTDGLARLFGTQAEPLRLARNLGLNLIDRLPVLKKRLIAHALGRPR